MEKLVASEFARDSRVALILGPKKAFRGQFSRAGGRTLMRPRVIAVTILALTVFGAVAADAQAPGTRQYAAKFICGKTSGEQPASFLAAPGSYFTVINVHNPAPSAAVEFRKKFTVGLPNEKAGKVSEFFPASLKADETMQTECRNIYGHLGIAPGTFIEGFVVLEIKERELDVVGVYTAAPPNGGVSTLHMERVPGRITQ